MNILVTGAAGFVGSHLAERLAGKHNVFGLLHDIGQYGPLGVDCLSGDVTDLARMLDILVNREIDQVYHLAARSIVRNCCRDPLGCFRTNILGTATVLEAARQSERIKGVLVMESDKAYGDGPVPYREEQPLQPKGVYEASKAAASHIMACYHANYGLPVFSVRCANIYGPRDPNRSRLVPNTILRVLAGELPQITSGAWEFEREFIYLDDACEALEGLMAVGPWGQAINVGSGVTCSVTDVIVRIMQLLIECGIDVRERSVSTWDRPATLLEIPVQWLSLVKLRGLLPTFSPRCLDDGLRETIAWYKDRSAFDLQLDQIKEGAARCST